MVYESVKSQLLFDKKKRWPEVAIIVYPNAPEETIKTALNLVSYRLFIERTSRKNLNFTLDVVKMY